MQLARAITRTVSSFVRKPVSFWVLAALLVVAVLAALAALGRRASSYVRAHNEYYDGDEDYEQTMADALAYMAKKKKKCDEKKRVWYKDECISQSTYARLTGTSKKKDEETEETCKAKNKKFYKGGCVSEKKFAKFGREDADSEANKKALLEFGNQVKQASAKKAQEASSPVAANSTEREDCGNDLMFSGGCISNDKCRDDIKGKNVPGAGTYRNMWSCRCDNGSTWDGSKCTCGGDKEFVRGNNGWYECKLKSVANNSQSGGGGFGSDYRLKKDIADASVKECGELVRRMELKSYVYKEAPDKPQLGFIAQQVRQVFPQSVLIEDKYGLPDCHLLDLKQLVMVLFGAVKDLQQKLSVAEAAAAGAAS